MLAPVLMDYGSKEQQDRFLPDIRDRKVNWCQGYSEPGAGSDLAQLKTKAELSEDGSHYIVNGTKIWTTLAHIADWIFCLTRTDDSGKKQEGITFLLFPMKQDGIEVKPIITLGGAHSVNMVHFTDVKVPVDNRVGEQDMGWTYAKGLLQHERTGLAGISRSIVALETLKGAGAHGEARQRHVAGRPCVRDQGCGARGRPDGRGVHRAALLSPPPQVVATLDPNLRSSSSRAPRSSSA